jgi:deoxyribonuclease V
MEPCFTHRWDLPVAEATRLQSELARRVVAEDRHGEIRTVAGVDVTYSSDSDRIVAAVAVLAADDLRLLETKTAEVLVSFPYVPSLFSFRELPAIVAVLRTLKLTPDLIVCDGQGIAHPRRFGLASHLGVLFDVATIGFAKTLLAGEAGEPDAERGSRSPILFHGEVVGNALRTRSGVEPVFVSPGHRISVTSACDWVLRLAPRFRLPETTRLADAIVRRGLARG